MHISQAIPTHLTPSSRSDLPACIERVAREQGAIHNANWLNARINLHANPFSVRCYLGTYLPRTVFEFMTLGNDMLSHAPMRKALPTNRPLRILDLGSGTGGAWMGLATALLSHGFKQGIEVDAVDGNAHALSRQAAFASAIAADAGVRIRVQTTCRELGANVDAFEQDLRSVLAQLARQYDFVLVSKHLSELYCAGGHAANGIVYQAVHLLSGALLPTGYLVVLDMTTRIHEVGEFFPSLLARELGIYLSQRPQGLRPVLPVPCAVSAQAGCTGGQGACYTQRHLHFQHSMTSAAALRPENTKVTFRVLAHRAQALQIAAGYPSNLAYHVNDCRDNQVCHRGHIVSNIRGFNGFLPPIQQAA